MRIVSLAKDISLKFFHGFELLLLLAIFYIVIGTVYFKNRFDLERTEEAVLYTFFWWTDETIWAPSFSEDKFRSVVPGMNKTEVVKLLGQPLQIVSECNAKDVENVLITMHYTSQSPICCSIYGNKNHQRRSIYISSSGIVLRRDAEFYFD